MPRSEHWRATQSPQARRPGGRHTQKMPNLVSSVQCSSISPIYLLIQVGSVCLVEEPDATFGLVNPILDQARGRNIAILVAKRVGASQADRQLHVVLAKFGQHLASRDEILVIIGDTLKLRDLAN